MSPEVLRSLCKTVPDPMQHKDRDDLIYDTKVDIWAVGVLAVELVTGRPPFRGSTVDEMRKAVRGEWVQCRRGESSLCGPACLLPPPPFTMPSSVLQATYQQNYY